MKRPEHHTVLLKERLIINYLPTYSGLFVPIFTVPVYICKLIGLDVYRYTNVVLSKLYVLCSSIGLFKTIKLTCRDPIQIQSNTPKCFFQVKARFHQEIFQ